MRTSFPLLLLSRPPGSSPFLSLKRRYFSSGRPYAQLLLCTKPCKNYHLGERVTMLPRPTWQILRACCFVRLDHGTWRRRSRWLRGAAGPPPGLTGISIDSAPHNHAMGTRRCKVKRTYMALCVSPSRAIARFENPIVWSQQNCSDFEGLSSKRATF